MFGDKWTLLIIREILRRGKATYRDLLNMEEGISTGVLSERISRMTRCGLILRRPSEEDGRSADYFLTMKGKALKPILEVIMGWVADHEMPELGGSAGAGATKAGE